MRTLFTTMTTNLKNYQHSKIFGILCIAKVFVIYIYIQVR